MLRKYHFRKSKLNIYGESDSKRRRLVWLLQKQIYLIFTSTYDITRLESLTF